MSGTTPAEPPGAWNLYLVSNTHWDREWYLGLYALNHRLVRMMDRLLDILERQTDYRGFLLDGQVLPALDYLAIRPECEERVRRLVREDRLHIGPLYSQSSETLVSGESLIRNFALGLRRCAKLGGHLPACYIIDQLGHVSQMPQIARGFGFSDVVLWRGVPEDAPGVFSWVGPDGSRVLLFHANDGYGDSAALPSDDAGLAERIEAVVGVRGPRATSRHLLALNGVDHSFAQANMPELIRRINQLLPSVLARHATLPEYIQAVRRDHEKAGRPFEECHGELMRPSDTLPDVHSFRTDLKARNSRVERLLERWAEPFAAIAWGLGMPYPGAELWKAWELVLQNQAHDSIGCSSVDSVRSSVLTRYDWAEEIGSEIASESLQSITNSASRSLDTEPGAQLLPIAVFNPLSWERTEPVTAAFDVPAAWRWRAARIFDGSREVPCDILERRQTVSRSFNPFRGWPTYSRVVHFALRFPATDVPPHGYRLYRLESAEAQRPRTMASRAPGVAENEHFRVEGQANGSIDLLEKATGRVFRGLLVFEDGGEAGTGFKHLAPQRDAIVTSLEGRARITDGGSTDLCSMLCIESQMELPASLEPGRQGRSTETVVCRFSTMISLPTGVPRVDVTTGIWNAAKDHRLRVLIPFGRPVADVHVEQPFDVVRRSAILAPRDAADAPARCMQAFVDMADDEGGLMVAGDGLYEYEVLDDGRGTLALTLLRCTDRLDLGGHYDAEEERMPLGQEIGEHEFRYSLIPHQGGWQAGLRHAHGFRSPFRAVFRRPVEDEVLPDYMDPTDGVALPGSHSFLEIQPPQLVATAIKRVDDRATLLVRVFNTDSEPVQGAIRIRLPGRSVTSAFLTDLKEDRLRLLPVGGDGAVRFGVVGRGLATIEAALGERRERYSPIGPEAGPAC